MESTTTSDESPESSETPKLERLASSLTKLVTTVVQDGFGPVTGSATWSEKRLERVQGDRYDSSRAGNRAPHEDADDVDRVIRRLITEATQAAGVNGFVTGVGGLVALPVTIPANMAGALVINARLAGAIAYLRGYDLADPHTQTVITLVAAGSTTQQILSAFGVKLGEKAAVQAIKAIPISVLRSINKKAGFFLVAKYGTQRAAVTIAKAVPLVGGVVGGTVDATMTQLVGRTANAMFPLDVADRPARNERRWFRSRGDGNAA
ncbi:EcsC family protein [Cellulosimicrobium sp. CpK407]|uniref:EcsC family protein n=1 Tax=Cellulosimicrobium sp. CpK407 TaxID=3229847 RepID=UPI003F3C224D